MRLINILQSVLCTWFALVAWPQTQSQANNATVVSSNAPGEGASNLNLAGAGYRFVREWGALALPGTFNSPNQLAVDAQGNIFVADMQNSRIEKFDSTGRFLLQWGGLGHKGGEFWMPQGVAVGAAGDVYVSDTYNNRIQVFTNDGEFIRVWGVRDQVMASSNFRNTSL